MLDIKQKFNLLNKAILTKEFLDDFLQKLPEQYTIYDLTRKWILAVIKRDESYLNLQYEKWPTPWIIGATYCGKTNYMFGWLAVYNLYGFTTQIANQYTIYSTIFYGDKVIYTTDFSFKKVKNEVIYGFDLKYDRWIYYSIMNIERAFIEYCKENMNKLAKLKEIYKRSINKQQLETLLKKYPYQNIRAFIIKKIILWQ